MKVTLINYTQDAKETLVFTKGTRLKMSAGQFEEVKTKSECELNEEIEYMANTIPSSWEFVDYTFMIEGVTRAFTHQLVRNRHGSYAQQTMRILDVSGFGYEVGPSIKAKPELFDKYVEMMEEINKTYTWLIENGAEVEDARGVLPTNIHTNIVAKFNLRTVAEILSKRASPRTQGEYREFLEQMRSEVLRVHPWAEVFLKNKKHEAAAALDKLLSESLLSIDEKINMMKKVDLLRGK